MSPKFAGPSIGWRVYRRLVLVPMRGIKRELRAWRHSNLPRVLETSIPKSGTHLLKGPLLQIGYRHAAHQPVNPDVLLDFDAASFRRRLSGFRAGEFVSEHLRWTRPLEELLAGLDYKVLLVHRDPRAVCMSFINYHLGSNFRFGDFMRALPNTRARIEAVLGGIADRDSSAGRGRAPLGELYDAFLPWRTSATAWVGAFEDLVGSEGGGSNERQFLAIERLLAHLGCDTSEASVRAAAERVFDRNAATFRAGTTDGWRRELAKDEIDLLNSRLERQILEWGYSRQ